MNRTIRLLIPYLLLIALAVVALVVVQTWLGVLNLTAVVIIMGVALAIWPTWVRLFWRREPLDILPTSEIQSDLHQPMPHLNGRNGANTSDLEERIKELKMLGQFSEALNFTINFDALLWLIYTNCQGVLNGRDFFIYLPDPRTDRLFPAFWMENGQRLPRKEGAAHPVTDMRVEQVIEIGQVYQYQDEHGRYWVIAPMSAGADTVGALQATHAQTGVPFTADQQELFNQLATRTATAAERWQTNQKLEIRAQQLQTLNDVIHSINSQTEIQPLLNLILDKAIELLEVEAGSFMLRDENTGELEFVVVQGPASQNLLGTRLPPGKGVAGQAALTGKPVLVNNVESSKQWFSDVDASTAFHTRSILTVPLLYQRAVLGVLQVVNRRNGAPFVQSDMVLLTAFAGEAAVTLENTRLLQQTDEELQRRVRELTLLQDLDRDLNQTLNLRASLELALGWMMRLFDATAGSIVIFDNDDRLLAIERQGYDMMGDATMFSFGTREEFPGLLGEVSRNGEPHVTGNVQEVAEYHAGSSTTLAQMTIPIIHEKRTIGAASIESDQPNKYGGDDLEAAVRFISHTTVAIANALLYADVQAANNAKSEFVSLVSHELKTPLTAIRGYTDLMLTGLTGAISSQQREYMGTIVNNVTRMMDLIQDLTDISRLDTRQLSVKLEPIPFAHVVSETIASIQSVADHKQIHIHLNMPPDLPLVLGDHSRLVQVLTNLLGNACKYSPPNTNVWVSIRREFDAGNRPLVWCVVKDSGYGISADDQAKLFTKFFRSADPNVRLASGTGLGLFITKGLVELHGGELTFESELGHGTSFSFSLLEAATSEAAALMAKKR